MLRFIGRIFSFILLVFVVWFATSNTDPVSFKMDILFPADGYSLPGYLWGLILAGGGFVIGAISSMASGGERRKKVRATKRELKQAKKSIQLKDKEIEKIQATGPAQDDSNPVAKLTTSKTTAS